MLRLLSGLGAGGVLGTATGSAYWLADTVLNGVTHVPLENAVAVGVFCTGLVWWAGRRFQRIDDNFERVQPVVEKVSQLDVINARLKSIEDKCGKWCPAMDNPAMIRNLPAENQALLLAHGEILKKLAGPDYHAVEAIHKQIEDDHQKKSQT